MNELSTITDVCYNLDVSVLIGMCRRDLIIESDIIMHHTRDTNSIIR